MSCGSEPNSPSNGEYEDPRYLESIIPHGVLRVRLQEGTEAPMAGAAEISQAGHIIFENNGDVSSSESEDECYPNEPRSKDPAPVPPVVDVRKAASVGSLDHGSPAGCRPCAFYLSSTGCRNGIECSFCHMDHTPEERQLPKPSSRPAKGKRDKDKRRIAEINRKFASDEPRRLEELQRFAESQAYAARLLGFEGHKGGKGGKSFGSAASAASSSSAARRELPGIYL
mmetsp:Transcript_77346/g.121850  ORF Transcript_77346/g.121850 Transcript_77346/m.121850 type:complete len:227 (-) Transcript_77346:166-846(-)